ncbi:AraC family transcriptional regulator [Bifidobacterium sp. ESL0790]|uniref:AraC family transcriptional regulator n=1 Tax=Bifidobacterium sp. ESL0790 TaxID=2983233 RepID=UPI0023F9FEF1|nr:AraC family transcriptional regulator [Bifidobacterium sp. ESL0790]WEV72765.1 AraC family transcriptional regulator [Bifidobacterium sp. ESL0790]
MDARQDTPRAHKIITSDYLEEKVYPEEYPALVIVHNNSHREVPTHWHRGMEIAHAISGNLLFTVGAKKHTVRAGETLLISPYDIHGAVIRDPYKGISITFNADIVNRLYPFADRYLFDIDAPKASDDDRERLNELITTVTEQATSKKHDSGFLLNAALYEMLALLYRNFAYDVRRPEEIRRGRNIIQAIIGYLNAHYTEPLNENFVAEQFGYSREHFSRLFKKATGNSFKEYLTELRLQDAYAKVLTSTIPLADISDSSGFPNKASLNYAFQRRYDFTPKELRQLGRRQSDDSGEPDKKEREHSA